MKIVHIAHSADGGAGRAARRASAACNAVGLKSLFACATSDGALGSREFTLHTAEPAAKSIARVLSSDLQWGLIPQVRSPDGYSLFTIAYPGINLDTHPAIAAADIIHLHWPSWTVTPPAIRRLTEAGKTVFLTLHDMWMFTGGCHYASGCQQFETACMKCPQITDRLGLASANFEDKLAAYGGGLPDLHVVALCRWMQDLAGSSRILGNSPSHLIPNPIETDVFKPQDRLALRQDLGINDGDAVLLFGNYDNNETRKGADILNRALEIFARHPATIAFPGRIHLMSFGRNSTIQVPAPLNGINVGQISDDAVLAGLYSSADLLCFPSVEDNYPNSVVEAAACGTPSVAFRTGGMADMIHHGKTGWLVDALGDAEAFAEGLMQGLTTLLGNQEARSASRQQTLDSNTMEAVGHQLAQAYRNALVVRSSTGQPVNQTSEGGLITTTAEEPSSADAEPRLIDTILSRISLENDASLGSPFLKLPIIRFLQDKGIKDPEQHTQKLVRYLPPECKSQRLRILAVRSFHEHHSAHSGPYQFLRHLPPETFDITNVMVPLGTDLAPSVEIREKAEMLGKLIGTAPFGTQTNAWAAEWDIARQLRRDRYDLVHFIDGELNGWLVSRLPSSFFAQGQRPAFLTMLHQPEHLAADWCSTAALRRFDTLGGVAAHQAEWLDAMVPGVPALSVPHGIDTNFFCPAEIAYTEKSAVRDSNSPIRLLAVGHWLRDYDLAFAALDLLIAEGMDIEYRVICHSLNRPSLPPYVTLLSGISDEELRQEYRNADTLFMPLAAATANNALLESMACGTPVVSTAIGGVPEYVDPSAGTLCAPTPEACAASLRAILRDPDRRSRMNRAARVHAKTFDWRHIAHQFETIYQELCVATSKRERYTA